MALHSQQAKKQAPAASNALLRASGACSFFIGRKMPWTYLLDSAIFSGR
jgi:hypothetical protein